MRRATLPILLAATAAACATDASPLETAPRKPTPLSAAAFGSAAPAVHPAPGVEAAKATMDAARARGSLRLEDCVRASLGMQEDLVAGDEARFRAFLQRDIARSAALPSVHMLLAHDRKDPAGGTVSGSGSGSDSRPVTTQWYLNVVQPIFQGFRDLHAVRSQDAAAEALAEDRRTLERAFATSVARAFFEVVEADAERKPLEESLRLDEERVQEMTARAEQGLARRTEVLLQESRRETTRAALSEVRERRDAARVLLERLIGAGEPVPAREEALIQAALLRSDIRAAERRGDAAAEDLKAASAQRSPRLSAAGNWYFDRWNYSDTDSRTRWDLGLVVDLPLFAGGAFDAQERIARSRIRDAALDRSRVLRTMVEEVDGSLVHLRAGLERLEPLRTNEKFARENLSLLQEEYRQGLATNLEVFTAQTQLQDAAVGLERQEIRSRLDRLEVFLAIGRVDVVEAMIRPAPALVLALAAAAASACGPKDATPAAPAAGAANARAYRVSVQPVESRPLSYAVEAVGTLEAYDVLAVPARVAGVLESLSFDEGDSVARDQQLAVVDGKRYGIQLDQQKAALGRVEAAVESARARTGQAAAALKEAETALERHRGLRAKNAGWVTEDEISSLEAAVARTKAALQEAAAGEKVAAAQVDEARTNVAIAAKDVEDARVRSPIAGTIERRQVSPGQYVRPGDPIATLVDSSRLRVRFRVSEAESVRIRPSQAIEVRVAAFPDRAFGADVFHVNATADPVTRMVECLASVKEPEKGLKPGFFATVRAVVSQSGDAVVIPVAAVLPTERGFTCFVIEEGKARERRLLLGLHTKDDGVEVVTGLRKGETLAVEGAASLVEGVPVEVVAPSMAKAAAPTAGEGAR